MFLFQGGVYFTSVQSRPRFCVIDTDIPFWRKMKLLWHHTNTKRVIWYNISSSKAAGSNESKFKKWVCLLAENECTKWLILDFLLRSSFCVRPRSMQFQERLEHTLQLSAYVALLIDSCFICWHCCFVFISLWNDNKSRVHFVGQKECQLNLKSIKMG